MPPQTRLHRRGGRYYIRAKVPVDLQTAMKRKEIKRTLKTSDFREAVRRVKLESTKLDALFDDARDVVNRGSHGLSGITEAQAIQLVTRWFVEAERKSEDWYDRRFRELTSNGKAEMLADLRTDEAMYREGDLDDQSQGDGTAELQRILRENGREANPKDPLFTKLAALLRKAKLENIHRSMQRLAGDVPTEHDKRVWRAVQERKEAAAKCDLTLGEMLRRFEDELPKAGRSEGTIRGYQMPIRILKETIGEDTPLESIKREHMLKVRDFLKTIPVNATQRFKRKTLAEAVRDAESRPDVKRLNDRTASNYLNMMVGIFNYAVKTCELARNPARDEWLKQGFRQKRKIKPVFTVEELNSLFRAPLFTGCEDDENGYAKRGIYMGRRGRFWVPLLALFHGLRLNEACQLYSEDIREVDGVACLLIRDNVDAGSPTDKRLKTVSSERTIPIHAELLKMGFLEYVERRRLRRKEPRLFPELTKGMTGKFSDPFGKWFTRFLTSVLGAKPKATFHSFRHMFRDALRRADVGIEKVEALGGWKSDRSSEADYGQGFKMPALKVEIDKVQYAVSLVHLHRKTHPESALPE